MSAGPLHVLLVEDDPEDAELVCEDLAEAAGGEVELDRVERLADAEKRLGERRFDAVLLDLMLPDGEGLEGLMRVRELAPDVAVVVMTGLDDRDLGLEAVRSGAQDYLVKGRADGEMVARALRYSVERKRSEAALREEVTVSGALARVGRALMEALGQAGLLDRLCRLTAETLACEASHTFQWAEDETLVPLAGCGDRQEDWEELQVVRFPAPAGDGLLAMLARDDVAPIGGEAGLPPLAAALRGQLGFRSALALALKRGDEVFGVQLAERRSRGDPFREVEIRIARGLAALASLVLEQNRLVEELRRANRLKSDFVATMSHELRTPLNVVLGYHELLLDGAFGELAGEKREAVERANRSARELYELITATLDISRIESGRVAIHYDTIEIARLWPGVERELLQKWSTRRERVRFVRDLPDDLPPVRTDPAKLKVILKNLVDNAFKFTEQGTVELRARGRAGVVAVSVRDSGIGIAAEHLPIIFEPFRQVDSSDTRAYGGVGLGLYVVSRLAELIGARIEVASEPGQGSEFTLYLPLEPPHREAR